MTLKDLKGKSASDLAKTLNDLRDELFRLKLKKSTNQLEKTHRLSQIKRDIARIHTLKNAAGEGK